jgi:hypothetical protein
MEKIDGLDDNQAEIFEDDNDENASKLKSNSKKSYFEEQEEIKKSLNEALNKSKIESDKESNDDDDGFLKVKSKTKEQKVLKSFI